MSGWFLKYFRFIIQAEDKTGFRAMNEAVYRGCTSDLDICANA